MRTYINIIIVCLLSFSVLSSCSKKEGCTNPDATNFNPDAEKDDGSCIIENAEKGTFQLKFNAKITNGQPFVFNQTYFDSLNYAIRIESFKFYVMNVKLISDNNVEVPIKDLELIDFKNNGTTSIKSEVGTGNYIGIKFNIGVDSIANHKDPTQYPNNHPLSLYQNTYWNWSTQYRFLMLEGKADTVNGSNTNLDQLLIYHTGTDPLYREFSKNINFSITSNSDYTQNLTIDLNKIFYGSAGNIDLKTESVTHTTTNYSLAVKVTENFLDAIE